MIYESILDTIGNTPVVKLHRIPPKHVTIYVKIEAFNPLGSIKDRLALGVIEAAERCSVTQPRINDLLRGRVSRFSLDALVNIATVYLFWRLKIRK